MPGKESLKNVYLEELRDLWSANDQMARIVQDLSGKASDAKLKKTLEKSVNGITKHPAMLKSLLESSGGEVSKDHCKGIE